MTALWKRQPGCCAEAGGEGRGGAEEPEGKQRRVQAGEAAASLGCEQGRDNGE